MEYFVQSAMDPRYVARVLRAWAGAAAGAVETAPKAAGLVSGAAALAAKTAAVLVL